MVEYCQKKTNGFVRNTVKGGLKNEYFLKKIHGFLIWWTLLEKIVSYKISLENIKMFFF